MSNTINIRTLVVFALLALGIPSIQFSANADQTNPAAGDAAAAQAPQLDLINAKDEGTKAKKRNQPTAKKEEAKDAPSNKPGRKGKASARKKKSDDAEAGKNGSAPKKKDDDASENEEDVEVEVDISKAGKSERDELVETLQDEVELLNLYRDKLVSENIIAKEEVIKALTERESATEVIEMELEELDLQLKQRAAKLKLELEEMQAEKSRVMLEAEIEKARNDAEISRLKLEEEERRSNLSRLTSEISVKEKEMERNNYTDDSPVYLANPLEGKRLVVSDRRVALNGLISSKTADYISERINYFNNKDKKMPIFIIIDNSPGGSVMSGYKILKAMEGSQAPVYVVVKSFAASMTACITTLADKSFAYPNAVILHHQLSGFAFGNLTQQREFVEEAEEWWRRLAGPIAEKMGISLEEFIDLMYENASTGDWVEFADEAKKLKWVDTIIDEIRETSLIKNPDARSNGGGGESSSYHYQVEEQIDDEGKPFVSLPRLAPFDYYWLYNPDEYYRAK